MSHDIERWLPIEGHGGMYEVSDTGQVRSRHSGTWRMLALAVMSTGYHRVSLCFQGSQVPADAHTLVLEAFVGPRPKGLVTRHLNGVRTDNRLTNLAYGTYSENSADMMRHGNSVNAAKTHCPQDHEYTSDNTKWTNGWRHCRTCERLRERNRYWRRKESA